MRNNKKDFKVEYEQVDIPEEEARRRLSAVFELLFNIDKRNNPKEYE